MIKQDNWNNCYDSNWKSAPLIPEAYSHPAKVSFGLAERIYNHMEEEGWIEQGMTVIDPFGGIGGFAFHALLHGLNIILVELEPRFVQLGNQNIALWNKRYQGKLRRFGTAVLLQGDSRELERIVERAGACVSSPPYQTETEGSGININKPVTFRGVLREGTLSMGISPSNLGNMRSTAGGLAGAISSPPYAEAQAHPSIGSVNKDDWGHDGHDIVARRGLDPDYGSTPGQLGAMRAAPQASVSSPPYEATDLHSGGWNSEKASNNADPRFIPYGDTPGQLGQASDFWTAARTIADQLYQVLAPGAHAVWVVKAFVKNKQIVDFPGQWQAMCEAAGFVTVHVHRAWLVKDKGTQIDLEGNHHRKKVERKSFFRRLAEQKGSPRIDFECVLCMAKPAQGESDNT